MTCSLCKIMFLRFISVIWSSYFSVVAVNNNTSLAYMTVYLSILQLVDFCGLFFAINGGAVVNTLVHVN